MRFVVASGCNARIQARAITCGIRRHTRERAAITAIAIRNVSVVAFFLGANEKITALIRATNAIDANLSIRTIRAVGDFRPRSTRMVVTANFRAIAGIAITAFRIARCRTLIVARKGAIHFATVTIEHIAVVASLKPLDFAIATYGLTGTACAAIAPDVSTACACVSPRRACPLRCNGYFVTATPSK